MFNKPIMTFCQVNVKTTYTNAKWHIACTETVARKTVDGFSFVPDSTGSELKESPSLRRGGRGCLLWKGGS